MPFLAPFSMFPREVSLSRVPRPPSEPRPVPPSVQAIAEIGRSLARTRREQAAREETDTKPVERVSLPED